jgi:hypothetical protein
MPRYTNSVKRSECHDEEILGENGKLVMDLSNPPERYWHCSVKLTGEKNYAVVNDLSFSELEKAIVFPWNAGRAFTVSGTVVRANASISQIRIAHTTEPMKFYSERYNQRMRESGIADMATNRRLLPLSQGTDLTYELLFAGASDATPTPSATMVEHICRRLPQAARILALRARKDKSPYEITDEYDVQDLLHATLQAYLKYSVQEDPLPKVAAAKAGRADISIEELGILVEVKFVHGPEDQKRLFEDYSQDLVLYAQWPHLKTLIYLVYNSAKLRDPEAFEKLSAEHEIGGKRFNVRVVLS